MRRRACAALLLVALSATHAMAARDFVKDTANYVTCGTGNISAALNGASAVSVHAIVTADTFTNTTTNRVMSVVIAGAGSIGLHLGVDGTASDVLQVGGRSIGSDTFRTQNGATTLSTGTEYAVGGVMQIPTDNIVVYLNGAQDGSGISGTWANATWADGNDQSVADAIGFAAVAVPPSATTHMWDGRIAELAIWSSDIGAAGFAQVGADRVSPLRVSPSTLVFYARMVESGGIFNLMSDTATNTCTITEGTPGTIALAGHPRVFHSGPPVFMQALTGAAAVASSVRSMMLLGVGR